jgi:aminopeptidase N
VLLLIVFLSSALKAKFQAQITVPETFTALFNTKELSVTNKNGMKTYLFEQTPGPHLLQVIISFLLIFDSVLLAPTKTLNITTVPMSSYLVCFAIGEFDFQERVSRGIRYRVYTPVGYTYLTTFSLDLSVKVIEYFSGEFRFIL